MDALFETVLQMSLSAAVLTVIVLLVRLLLQKAPKWIICALWALVAVRLLCPVSFESNFSMMPNTEPVTQQIISVQPSAPTNTVITSSGQAVQISPNAPEPGFLFQFWMLWLAGIVGMLGYMLCSYFAVRKRVTVSVNSGDSVFQCDYIHTPFILGIFRPRIYLPSSLPPESREYVLAHEQAHLKRKDHWWKPLGFVLLSVHWFNPVIWLGYICLCRDIELACDERVIRDMDTGEKKAYSEALLTGSVQQRFVTACPLAFGEIGVKARVRSVLNYKKPAFWLILAALVLCVSVAVCFLTNRPGSEPPTDPPTDIVETTIHFEGMVIAQEGPYIQLRRETANTVRMIYVNISNFPELPQLKPGDIVLVHCNPSEDSDFWDDITEIRRIQVADWGILMRAADISPTGFQLYMGYSGGFPRTLTTTDAYYLEKKDGSQWTAVPGILDGAFSDRTYNMSSGNYYDISWEHIYGALEPGKYRFCKTISFDGEDRVYDVEFTVLAPLPTDLETAVTQTVRYILSKQLVNPALPHDKSLEHIPQDEETGFLDEPVAGESIGKTFDQITESHMILDQKQSDDIYTLTIVGMCRGYNNRVFQEEFFSPMLLTLRKNPDSTYVATSCKIPTSLYYQADMELLFPAEMVQKILDGYKSHYNALADACDKQVTGGMIALQGFGQTYEPDSIEGKLILQTIESGKKYTHSYSDNSVCTIYIGDTVHYYYFKPGIIHNVTDNVYTQLTEEGRGILKTILDLVN